MVGINHMVFIDMEIKRMVGLLGIMRVTVLGFLPTDDFTHILHNGFTCGNILHGEYALAMDAGASGLDTAAGGWGQGCAGHFFSDTLNMHTCACARMRESRILKA